LILAGTSIIIFKIVEHFVQSYFVRELFSWLTYLVYVSVPSVPVFSRFWKVFEL
jgi:hypothetical protein